MAGSGGGVQEQAPTGRRGGRKSFGETATDEKTSVGWALGCEWRHMASSEEINRASTGENNSNNDKTMVFPNVCCWAYRRGCLK